ncbi:hypothetical protein Dsin_029245 [Dipteronia sinensis]|uniref:Transposase MuDR plant domain-containing protein n=1 Tax=Dipteronia sinensis TaxID=43782 RepID=A0AAE0DVD6_9ROSI|nr:hypothetical protein Dsin_029245 [Dipteronia sinensis]
MLAADLQLPAKPNESSFSVSCLQHESLFGVDLLFRVVQGVANVDLTRFAIELRTLVDTSVRLRPARPKIKDDNDMEMLMCDKGHVPEVYFQFGGGSNNVLASIPITDNAFEILSVNPVISEDPTINEVLAEPYNEDERSILEYNPHSEYGLDDFDEDCISHRGSREGVNDESPHYHVMGSDPTDCGRRGSVPPVFTGPSRDTFEDDAINVGNRSRTVVSQPWIIPGASNYSLELVRTEESSSYNRLSKGVMFESKKGLKRALLSYALKENFEICVTRSCTGKYEVGCKDPECKFQ